MSLDHVVHYVNDVPGAVETFKQEGIHAVMGGSHKQWGTHNGLAYFNLSYIEWLGIEDESSLKQAYGQNPVFQDAGVLLPESPVLHKFAIRTSHIEQVCQSLEEKGIRTSGVLANSRQDRKGRSIRWKMLILENSPEQMPYPFFIEWEESDCERLKKLKESGVIPERASHDIRISELVFHTSSPADVKDEWASLFGIQVEDDEVNTLNIDGVRLVFRKGIQNRLTSVILEGKLLDDKRIKIEGSEYKLVSSC
ncbi:VOC family protein [Salisediminibacterium selenitireducens]|nr:VOC family protein [Salisediminibacterium selenitireducens]